jgi:Ca-activated chloride channel homolog
MRQKSLFVRAAKVCLFLILCAIPVSSQTENSSEGSLRVTGAETSASKGLCPLKRTDVRAEISGYVSRVTVTQIFENPLPEKIEAVYTFPLPNDAAVDDLTIEVGGRLVKGRIMERRQAQQTYDAAKKQGRTAALLTEERPNIFTQAVANITPGAEIKVVITYVETLKYADDTYEFRFPMTIGERYLPSSVSAKDAARISPKSKKRPGHTVSLAIELDAGVSVENLASTTHAIESQPLSASRYAVRLADLDEIPNRDFVLRYRTAGVKMEDALLAHRDARGGFFTLILQPPDRIMPAEAMPKEIVFVLDTSGSMDGFPIKKAKEAMRLTLENINPNDTFNLITFAGDTRVLFEKPVPATRENLDRARRWLDDSEAGGGTEMMTAIRAALAPSDSPSHVRVVCFMTDGYVGNEKEIIGEVQKTPTARVFAFGIGDSVNHYLLDEIAREGRGEVEYVGLKDDGSAAARRFYERIRNPLLTDIALEFAGVEATEIYPKMIPDLFDAKPVAVVGRYRGAGTGRITLRGKMQGQTFSREIVVDFPAETTGGESLATIWARRKIAELTRAETAAPGQKAAADELRAAITGLGLEFRILTAYTSFVAVDELIVTDGGEPRRVEVPVAAPDNGGFVENYWERRDPQVVSGAGAGGGGNSTVSSVDGASGVSETVTVTADYVRTDSTDTKIDTNVVVAQGLASLPKGRSFQSLLSTATGVTSTAEIRSQLRGGLISSNGQRASSNLFTVDGLSANTAVAADDSSLGGDLGAVPALTASGGTNGLLALEATEEVQVRTIAAAKEQRTAGATVNFASRAGSNSYRGSVFEIFGHEKLNANDFFANSRGARRPPARLNQFGGALGGFLIKDRAWFYANYEALRLRQPGFAVAEVPGAAARLAAVPALRPLFEAFPLADGPLTAGGFAESSASFVNPAAHDIFGLRVDTQPSSKIRIGGRYNFADSTADRRADRDYSLNTVRNSEARSDALSLWTAFTPTSNVVVDGRVNFSRSALGQRFSLDDFGGARPAAFFAPAFDFLKYDLGGRRAALAIGGTAATVDQFQANGLVTRIAGRHLLGFGADYRRLVLAAEAAPTERNTAFAGLVASGTAERVNEFRRAAPLAAAISNFSLFAQDDWRLTSRLNVSLGLRWDADFAAPAGELATAPAGYAARMPAQTGNFAPRASAAWDVFGRGVLRGGVGLYFDYANAAATRDRFEALPFAAGRVARNVDFNAPATVPLRLLHVFDRRFETPRVWQFFAEYQQEIFANHIVTANYTRAFGRRLTVTRTLAEAVPGSDFARATESRGESDYEALQLRFERRFSRGFSFNARYTLSEATDNWSPDLWRESYLTSADLAAERGASDFDARHQLNLSATYDLPAPFASGWRKNAFRDWSLTAFVNWRTAFPVDVVYARISDTGRLFERPDRLANAPLYLAGDGPRSINPAAFALAAGNGPGDLGRNALRGYALFQLDAALQRRVRLGNEMSLNLSIQAFNVLNNTNFAAPDGVLGTLGENGGFRPNHYFGRAVSTFGGGFTPFYFAGGPRTLQLSAKFVF